MPFFGVPIRNGLPIGLGSVAGFGVQQFDPSQLFEGGTVAGAWYDPSDLSTMFTTDAGTTPVAMPGQGAGVAVGLILDKSGNGNHARSFGAGLSSTRPELRARVNLLVATATLSTQNVTTQATSYTLSFAGAGSITLSGTATGSYNAGTHTITCTAGTLTLTVSGTVTTADLRPANSGALLPAYQAVVNADTYDTNGFPLYLRFDGIDDSMYTPANLDLSGTDKVSVFAGVRALQSAVQVIGELGADTNSTNGSFVLFKNNNGLGFASRGTSIVNINNSSGSVPPISSVLTGQSDISAPSISLRSNGTQVLSSTSSQGTGNYGTHPLYIGSRANSSLWFNGHLHGLIVVGSAVSAGNISATESWMAGKTGIQI